MHFEIAADFLGEPGPRAGFVLLGAFLLSFLFIRTSARLIRNPKVTWWPGNVETKGGLHIHHLVWGILLILIAGFLEFAVAPASPWLEILAALFGVGAGLTLDEFALWVHLEDVYWEDEGRASLDAVLVATLLAGLIVLGLSPFELANQTSAVTALAIAVAIDLLLCVVTILKGKPILGLTGVFVPLASLIGSLRLASPSSPWARWRYSDTGPKMARSQARFERMRQRRHRVRDAIGGAPGR
ncbi:MAG TPA: hypothetical protein VNZ01_04855 [Solirubrobacteraceae bacterium]|jgi:hypothetical protein|nr:hypothetical protein [Solirubrobacteraceae bacterium]